MEKLVFCFTRGPHLSRPDYFEHYLQHHAPLGLRLAKAIEGYTVNLTDQEDAGDDVPDAITEIWTSSADGFMDPARAFDSPEDAALLSADHDSFMGPFNVYVVAETVQRRRGSFDPLGTRTTLAKRVSFYGHDERPPVPPADVVEIIEHRVLRDLSGEGSVGLIVTTLAPTVDALGAPTGKCYTVSEFRQRDPAEDEVGFTTL